MIRIEIFSEKMGKVETIECDSINVRKGNPDWVHALKKDKLIAIVPANRVKVIHVEECVLDV